jgi:hypothetical protein
MKYTSTIDNEKKIIMVRFVGPLTEEDLAPIVLNTRLEAKKLKYKIIFDFRDTNNHISTVDACNWIFDHYEKVDIDLKFIQTAHITNKKDKDFFQFVETVFLNRGAAIKLFEDENAAIKWLTSD